MNGGDKGGTLRRGCDSVGLSDQIAFTSPLSLELRPHRLPTRPTLAAPVDHLPTLKPAFTIVGGVAAFDPDGVVS
jgi:hypothetical protein